MDLRGKNEGVYFLSSFDHKKENEDSISAICVVFKKGS